MGGCSLFYGTAFLSWQKKRGDNGPHPMGAVRDGACCGLPWRNTTNVTSRSSGMRHVFRLRPPTKMRRLSLIFAAKCAEIMRSIHKRPDRPTFQRDIANLAEHLAAICHTHGLLLGRMNALGFSIRFAEGCNHSGLG